LFLATTADQAYWKKDEEILFLGEWCKVFNQKHVWENLDYDVLPYHWDDRKKLYEDYKYLDRVYEELLPELTDQLNALHNSNHSIRYWRIIIGPWLYWFTQIIFDRYLSIRAAIDSGKVTKTWIPSTPLSEIVPVDFFYFKLRYCAADDYNLLLYSRIIEVIKGIPSEKKSFPSFCDQTGGSPLSPSSFFEKSLSQKLLLVYSKIIPDRWIRYVFVNSYIKIENLISLQLALGQFPHLLSPMVISPDIPVDAGLRKKLALKKRSDSFENLLRSIIPEQMPRVYLEGYSEMSQKSLSAFPKYPKVIFTSNGLYANEGFKFWAASQTERGVKLNTAPHGGGNLGAWLWSSNESHEHQVADKFYSWGWKDPSDSKVVPLTSGQLIGMDDRIKPDPNGKILWVSASYPRYSYVMFSAPVGPQVLDYIKNQEVFSQSVSSEVHDLLLLRLYPRERGWEEDKRWAEFDPSLNVYRGKKSIFNQLNLSRLAVITYIGTAYVETFVANYPTIIFWNPDHNETSSSAQPYFDALQRVGILHETPESAAAKVNEIYEDPMAWWQSEEVQEAKDNYCSQLARAPKNWRTIWKKEFEKVSVEQSG
jgi:putative transferase (TIGR04331 family)